MEMTNFNDSELVELNEVEVKETEGGNPAIIVAAAVITVIWGVNELSKDLQKGWNCY